MTGEKHGITEKELENITTKIFNLEQDKTEKKQEFFEGLDQVLSTDQRAKYYGFEIEPQITPIPSAIISKALGNRPGMNDW